MDPQNNDAGKHTDYSHNVVELAHEMSKNAAGTPERHWLSIDHQEGLDEEVRRKTKKKIQ